MSRGALLSLILTVLCCTRIRAQEFDVSPNTTILFPGDTIAVFYCTADPFVVAWEIDGMRYGLDELFAGDRSGHNVSGSNLTVSTPMNGTKYVCVIPRTPPTPSILSDPAFLYIAAAPDMPSITVYDLNNVKIMSNGIDFTFNFTLNWTVPFNNFDPILNYTITIGCTDGTGCPLTLTTDNATTILDVSYTTTVINVTIMVTANNTVDDSDPGIVEVAAPGVVRNITVTCEPVDLMNQCTVTWDLLGYGSNAAPARIEYFVEINGSGIENMMNTTDGSSVMFKNLSAVDSSIMAAVGSRNVFGEEPLGFPVESDTGIMASAVQGTTAMLLDVNTPAETYSVEVECAIRPNSTAEYCEVIARNDMDAVSASATIGDNDMATVTVDGLACEQTYTIVAGGIINQSLVGPRTRHSETTPVPPCPVMTTAMMSTAAPPMEETVTPSGTPTPTGDGGGSDSSSIGAIIGGVVGGIVAVIVIIVIVVVVYFFCFKDRESGSRTMSPSGDKLPVTSAGAGAGAGRPTSVRVQTLDRYGKPMTDESDAGNVELTDYKPVGSPEFTVNQMPSGNNQLTTKEESRTPSSYMPEGSYDTLAPADEPQGQSAPLTQNGQDQPQKGKLNYAELEQFSRKPASVKKPETQPPSQYAVIDPKSLQGTYT